MPWGCRSRSCSRSKGFRRDQGPAKGSDLHARDMAHLATRANLGLAVDVDVEVGLADELFPAVHVVADEIVHHRAFGDEVSGTHGQVADRADVLLELRRHGAF